MTLPRTPPLILLLAAAPALAQSHVIATVPVSEATTTGSLAISGSKALLGGASVITALDRTAHVSLFRGGDLLVCQTSVVHLTAASRLVGKNDPILISLDRGAMELQTSISRNDALITPDLRFVSVDTRDKPAPLDLALRITPNGDTCVENRGKKAPTLGITDAFGQSAYLLKPNQHVLFEHGSLKEVVDTETSPCGCPQSEGISLAEAALRGGTADKKQKKADPYPFPAAVSQGLATPTPPPPDKPGQTNVQVSGTLTYDPAAPAPTNQEASTTPPDAAPATPPAPPAEAKRDPVHSVGRFFKKLFAR